jgi:hypothetical protein
MKKRLEDRLIEFAFSDRTETDVAELATTPETAARLKEYRAMRSALGSLRELPEHQLSTERLREALLHQGLKRRRSFPWQALGYISAASSLFVCAFFLSRDVRRAGSQPQLALSTVKPDRSGVRMPEIKSTPSPSGSLALTMPPKVAPITSHRTRLHSHEVRNPDLVLNTDRKPVLKLVDNFQNPVNPSGGKWDGTRVSDARTAPGTSTPSHRASASNAMVLIQANTDADSGLDTAQEVTTNGDVLVGG